MDMKIAYREAEKLVCNLQKHIDDKLNLCYIIQV